MKDYQETKLETDNKNNNDNNNNDFNIQADPLSWPSDQIL